MTLLNKEQIQIFAGLVATAEPDGITCDECNGQVSQYAEQYLEGLPLSEGMSVVERHLRQCPCCKVVLEVVLAAMQELEATYS